MNEPDHLTEEQFAQYCSQGLGSQGLGSRRLAPLKLLQMDDHLAQCSICREQLYRRERAGSQLRQLKADFDGHLDYNQVAACAQGTFPPEVAQHLKECDMCRAEVDDLTQFRTEIEHAPRTAIRMPARPIPWLAAAAALLLAAGLSFWLFRENPVPVAPIAVAPKAGEPSLTPEENEVVRLALDSHKLERAPILERLIAKRGILMGSDSGGTEFELSAPMGTAVLADRPLFQWKAAPGAERYVVAIFDENFESVLESPPVTATEWQPDRPLPRNRILNWQVSTTVAGRKIHAPTPPAPEARFLIVSRETEDRIEAARREHPANHVLLAALYARAGALREAGQELDELAASDRATADALRQSLR